jgi:DNA-binding LytR/AlgR family response regulator
MFKILKQPYPNCTEPKCFLKCALVACPFIYVFLLIFQPFGLNFLEPSLKHPVFLGYAAVCYIMLGLNILILPRLFKNLFDEEKWTVLHQIVWEIWTVFTIGAGNYFFTHRIVDYLSELDYGSASFFWFQKITLAIAVIPVIVLTMWTQIYLLRKNLKAAQEINAQIKATAMDTPSKLPVEPTQRHKLVLKSDSDRETLEVDPGNILFIESEGNYVEVTFQKEKDETESVLLRSSLKGIVKQLRAFPFLFKCHRSYIVNVKRIKRTNGNAQGYKLHLENCNKEIPVARSYLKKFKELMRQH